MSPDPGGARRPRISVVNDNPEFLELMSAILEDDAGFDVRLHEGEATKLADLRALRPDLIIIDLLLGSASGWDIVALARADDALSNVPIIVCTADVAQLRQRERELATIGDVRVLRKPFGLDDLLGLVNELLADREPADGGESD